MQKLEPWFSSISAYRLIGVPFWSRYPGKCGLLQRVMARWNQPAYGVSTCACWWGIKRRGIVGATSVATCVVSWWYINRSSMRRPARGQPIDRAATILTYLFNPTSETASTICIGPNSILKHRYRRLLSTAIINSKGGQGRPSHPETYPYLFYPVLTC